MDATLTIAGVCERDLDLLLLEEFFASSAFRSWFAARCGVPSLPSGAPFEVRRSVTQGLGESDLELLLHLEAGTVRLLIENKVDSAFQRDQAFRYRERAASYVLTGSCGRALTVLTAPLDYASDPEDTRGFDCRITYEEVRDWFEAHGSEPDRVRYKVALLKAAIEKSKLGYQPVADAPVTDFWREYWVLVQTRAPSLEMPEPEAKPALAGFIYFRPSILPRGVTVCHKLPHGNVDLQISGWGRRMPELRRALAPHLDPDMVVVRAAESAAVRLKVGRLNTARRFAEQCEEVERGLAAAERLLRWFNDHRAVLPV